jgi:hypothetical protein
VDEPSSPTACPEPQTKVGRLGNGAVQRAVVSALVATDGPMRSAEIHLAVERLLGHPVSKNSVSWCLATGARARIPRFQRTAPGAIGCRSPLPDTACCR